jgi:AcrR family transcriptional regulator
LQAAALEAFATRGFHGTTTRHIATAAGLSPAAMYVHHRSKEELLFELSRIGHERTLAEVRDAVAASDDPRTQLADLVRAFVRRHARERTTARVVNYELGALTPEHRRAIVAIRHTIDGVVTGVVAEGVRRGEFRTADPALTAAALLSLGVDVSRWFRDGGPWTPDEIADHYAELALRMVSAG